MRIRQRPLAPALAVLGAAVLGCSVLLGCTGGGRSSAGPSATSAPASPAGTPRAAGRLGSPGRPLLLSCGQEAYSVPPVPQHPQPGDLAIGPLIIVEGKRLATESPAGHGSHGSYKIPVIVTLGSTVTITIAAPARGQVVIDNPYSPVGGVIAATYRSCSRTPGFFAQSFAFTRGQIRGCVPLDVRIGHEADVHHVTLSLFAGSCARRSQHRGSAPAANAAEWAGLAGAAAGDGRTGHSRR